MIVAVKNKDGPVMCPVCKKDLDGRITHAQAAGTLKAEWVHVKCLGGTLHG